MKHLFAIFTICITVGAQAQELPKGLASNERDANFLHSIGVVGNPYQNKTAQATIHTTPPSCTMFALWLNGKKLKHLQLLGVLTTE